jgi:hypothetical protein
VTEAEHVARAREFVDGILRLNQQHGVGSSEGAIKYDAAVKAAVRTFRRLRKRSGATAQEKGV